MSKELIKSSQFARVDASVSLDEELKLNDEQKRELDSLYETTIDKLRPGELLIGKVVSLSSSGVLVDIAYKSDGLIPRFEFSDHELKNLKDGQEIEVILDELENIDGDVVLSYEKAKSMRAWDRIIQLSQEGKPVEGMVTHKVKGGLSVDIGVPAFLPGSQVDLQRVNDFDTFVGQVVTAEIIKINKKRGNVIISRRKYLSEKRADDRKRVMDSLTENQVIQGMVKNITNYGAFIDIGGIDGLLYITDMTWGRIGHPSEILKLGETITVKVLSIDQNNNKISLGLKQLEENPWQALPEDIKVGSKVKGIISSITDYGLFVEIQKGVEGLVHISEVSWTDRIHDLHKHYKVGQEIDAVVVTLDKNNRRMSLSVKQLEENPWQTVGQKFQVGDKIKSTVSNVTDFGVFIQLLPGVDGLAHISDLSWTEHIEHPSVLYKRSQEVEAVVLAVDEANKKVSLGIKQLTPDPWEELEEQYPIGSITTAVISKVTNNGRVFARLANGIEGILFDLIEPGKEKTSGVSVGDEHQVRIVNINKNDRKMSLSVRLEGAPPRSEMRFDSKKREKGASASAPSFTQSHDRKPQGKSMLQLELEKLKGKSDSDKKDEE
ncbi:MAG TPA: S1 RNA-binding domain-containing protein [Candidatus Babeliales bacterium]|nr:S1 RNA-binding domain-containing protein [Candidatus Babeliales bacterium]